MFNILLDPYWSQKKRILYTPFFWHSIGWVEIFYLFIFIWELRIRYWSRNVSQKLHRDVLLKRKPNRCIVAFDEAKSKSIVAFWWSEIPIDRRIVIERNSNWCIVESRDYWERRRVFRVLRVERRWVCRILRIGERRRVCRVLQFWDYNIIRCCDACLVDGICFHFVCINIGRSFYHFPSKQILLFHWLMSSHCLHFPN